MSRRTFGVLAMARRHPRLFSLLTAAALAACGGGAGSSPFEPTQPASCATRVVSIAIIGDSTALGFNGTHGLPTDKGPQQLVQAAMDAEFGAGSTVVTDLAVSGTTALQVPHINADVGVIVDGINDMRTEMETPAQFQAALLASGATLVVTQNPIADRGWPEADFVAAARSAGLPVADVNAWMLAQPDWLSLLGDAFHPSNAGYAAIYTNVVNPAIARQVAPLRCSGALS